MSVSEINLKLTPESIDINQNFIGRAEEIKKLSQLKNHEEALMIILYGRRRVGKTELLEQVFRDRNLLKFEGLEDKPEETQRQLVMNQLARYAGENLLKNIQTQTWQDVFEWIYKFTQTGTWTIYFEELQWLANYQDDFVKYLKLAWDNWFRRNPKIVLILCGSSASFIINHVIKSKALHNRSQYEFYLKPLSLKESAEFLSKRNFVEVLDGYLTLGGIPEYLKRLNLSDAHQQPSIFLSLCEQSFLPNAYFSTEYQRIFISSLSHNPLYKKIIELLSQHKFMTRGDLLEKLGANSGGRLTELLEELESSGFIEKYGSYHLGQKSALSRYGIKDAYLAYFFKFIQPELKNIDSGKYQSSPTQALSMQAYQQYLGYAFERFCRYSLHDIARILGFSAVQYEAGPFYSRALNQEVSGFQIDLLFDRKDRVITICEIKYRQGKIGTSVIEEFEKKLQALENFLKTKARTKSLHKTFHKVLIAPFGIDQALESRHYFDRVLTLEDFKNF